VRHRVEQRGGVADGAGQWAVAGETAPVAAQRPDADPAAARLEADDPAAARRDADGPAAVAALREGNQPGRDRGRRPAAGPAGVAGEVPRRASRADEVVVGVGGEPELRGIGLAEADEAGPADELDHVRVDRRHVVLQHDRAHGGAHAGGGGEVLERRRHTAERWRIVAGEQPVRRGRPHERVLGRDGDERPERVGVGVDAVEVVLDELDRRDLAASQGCGLRRRVEVVQLRHIASLG
jgi:hypothetical protein